MKKWFLKYKDQIVIGLIVFVLSKFIEYLVSLIGANKNLLFKVLSYQFSTKIYFIFIFVSLWWLLSMVYRNYKLRNNKLKIVRAKYYTESSSLDITDELNNAVQDNRLKIILSNNIAGDPHKGSKKQGSVKYVFNGIENERVYIEGEPIDLP